jgi:hypothetical protein
MVAMTMVGGHDPDGLQQRGYDMVLKAMGRGAATLVDFLFLCLLAVGINIQMPILFNKAFRGSKCHHQRFLRPP